MRGFNQGHIADSTGYPSGFILRGGASGNVLRRVITPIKAFDDPGTRAISDGDNAAVSDGAVHVGFNSGGRFNKSNDKGKLDQ